MTHTFRQFLPILLLVAAFEPLTALVRTVVPAFRGGALAVAQIPDPGFGDPTTLTPPADMGTPPGGYGNVPQAGYGNNAFNSYVTGNYITLPPAQPTSAVRPNSWPGGAPSPVPGYEQTRTAGAARGVIAPRRSSGPSRRRRRRRPTRPTIRLKSWPASDPNGSRLAKSCR